MTKSTVNPSKDGAAPKKKWHKVLLIVLFVLLNVAVIAAAGFSEFGNSENASELAEVHINGWWLVPAVICFVVAVVIDIYKYVLMMRRMSRGKDVQKRDLWKVARRTVLLGRYYDNITPAAVGGQPFQIYYMRKNSGLSNGASTSIPIFGMISIQIAFIVIALICFIFGNMMQTNPVLLVTALIGLLFFAFWPVMVAGTFIFPKAVTRFIKFIVKLLAKLHIVKNREQVFNKVEDEVLAYTGAVKTILKTRGLFVQVLAISLIYNVLVAAIPFFVLTAFGGNVNIWECFTLTMAVMAAVYFIPTPGNAGAAEGTFFVVFSALSTGYVFWAMLVWRLFSYYIYIIMGLIIYMVMQIEKKRGRIN